MCACARVCVGALPAVASLGALKASAHQGPPRVVGVTEGISHEMAGSLPGDLYGCPVFERGEQAVVAKFLLKTPFPRRLTLFSGFSSTASPPYAPPRDPPLTHS